MSLFAKIKSWPAKIKTWPSKKKLVVGLSIFAVLAASATAGLIIWQNAKDGEITRYNPNQIVGKEYPDESHLLVKGLDEIYHSNSLEWKITENENTYETISEKIYGLKNKTIEDKINKEIAQVRQELKNLPKAKGAEEKGYVFCDNSANFGNILSIGCSRNDYNPNSDEVINIGTRYLNYRLLTGEQFKFQDVFIAGANYNQIIAQAYDYTNARINSRCTYSDDPSDCAIGGQYEPAYQSDYEEQIVKLIRSFRDEGDTQFYLSSTGVDFVVADQTLHFEFAWDYSQVAIYKRFIDDGDIYNNDKKTSGFVFMSYLNSYTFGQITNNLFADCMITNYPFSWGGQATADNIIKKQLEIVNSKIQELSKMSGNQVVILTCYSYNQDSDEYDPYPGIGINFEIYKMSKSYYNKTAYGRIVEACHQPTIFGSPCANPYNGDDWNDHIMEYVNKNITNTTINDYYSLKDGKWVKETSDAHYDRVISEREKKEAEQRQKEYDEWCKKEFPGSVHYDESYGCLMSDGSLWIDVNWYNTTCSSQYSGTHYDRPTNSCVSDIPDAFGNYASYPF